jgi:sugar lactone lactonase YvrE
MRFSFRWIREFLGLRCAIAALVLLSQFGLAAATTATFSGTVVGAGLGVNGATVTIFSANSSGVSTVGFGTSDSNGNFSFSFSNPGGNNVLYAVATGGNLGQGVNPAIAMMAVIGTGASFASSVLIDEITTVASVWSMTQFIQSDGSISGPSPGLENAAATVPGLTDLPHGLPSTVLLSTLYNTPTKLNSLADILVPCIGSAGASSAECVALFSEATPSGATAPINTLQAAENIARHPETNASNLFAISMVDDVFGPTLTQAPPAWTLNIQYGAGGLAGPGSIAIDGQGNVWAGNLDGSGGVTKLGPGGVADPGSPFVAGGIGMISAVAVDHSGHVWAANRSSGTVSELDLNGTQISPDGGYSTDAGEDGRVFEAIAVDASGDIWLTDNPDSSLVELSPSGGLLSPPGDFKGGGIHFPTGIAIDAKGRLWVANDFIYPFGPKKEYGSVSEFDSGGHPLSPKKGYTKGGIGGPMAIAIDGKEDVWVADDGYLVDGKFDGGGATKLNPKGAPLSPKKGFKAGGISQPNAIAIDGAGDVWLVDGNNSLGCPVSELNSEGVAISPPSGYLLDGSCDSQQAIAIDGSGNIWIANTGISTLIEIVGAASPVENE